jgi:hypothetical protein
MKSLGLSTVVIAILIVIVGGCDEKRTKTRNATGSVATRASHRPSRPSAPQLQPFQKTAHKESASQPLGDTDDEDVCPEGSPETVPSEQQVPVQVTKQDVTTVEDQAGDLRNVIDSLEQVVRKAVETQERLLALKMSKDRERERVADNVREAEPQLATP